MSKTKRKIRHNDFLCKF